MTFPTANIWIFNFSVDLGTVRRNLHPGRQADLNVPIMDGKLQTGLQHKYRETVLIFPLQGQTCHTYCTYCFRWPQFMGKHNFRFANNNVMTLVHYLQRHPEVRDVMPVTPTVQHRR